MVDDAVQPFIVRSTASCGYAIDGAIATLLAGFGADRANEPLFDERCKGAIDEWSRQGDHLGELVVGGERLGDGKSVLRLLGDERKYHVIGQGVV